MTSLSYSAAGRLSYYMGTRTEPSTSYVVGIFYVDKYRQLWLNENDEDEWVNMLYKSEIGDMCGDEGNSYEYDCKVLSLTQTKTGNYKLLANMSGTLLPWDTTWSMLLDKNGKILKKCKVKMSPPDKYDMSYIL